MALRRARARCGRAISPSVRISARGRRRCARRCGGSRSCRGRGFRARPRSMRRRRGGRRISRRSSTAPRASRRGLRRRRCSPPARRSSGRSGACAMSIGARARSTSISSMACAGGRRCAWRRRGSRCRIRIFWSGRSCSCRSRRSRRHSCSRGGRLLPGARRTARSRCGGARRPRGRGRCGSSPASTAGGGSDARAGCSMSCRRISRGSAR